MSKEKVIITPQENRGINSGESDNIRSLDGIENLKPGGGKPDNSSGTGEGGGTGKAEKSSE